MCCRIHSASIFVYFIVELRNLVGRESQILLGISYFIAQMLIFLKKVLHFLLHHFTLTAIFLKLTPVLIQLAYNFLLLNIRKSDILLSSHIFLRQERIFLKKFLNFLFDLLGFSVVLTEFLFVVIELLHQLVGLSTGNSHFFLALTQLLVEIFILSRHSSELLFYLSELAG